MNAAAALNWKLRRFRIDSWIVTREPHTASSRKRLFNAALVRVSLCDLHFLTEPDGSLPAGELPAGLDGFEVGDVPDGFPGEEEVLPGETRSGGGGGGGGKFGRDPC